MSTSPSNIYDPNDHDQFGDEVLGKILFVQAGIGPEGSSPAPRDFDAAILKETLRYSWRVAIWHGPETLAPVVMDWVQDAAPGGVLWRAIVECPPERLGEWRKFIARWKSRGCEVREFGGLA
jgi:hypothetical protein